MQLSPSWVMYIHTEWKCNHLQNVPKALKSGLIALLFSCYTSSMYIHVYWEKVSINNLCIPLCRMFTVGGKL